MNTGAAFSKVGRDGVLNASEKPSGDHGRHAMLIVGYIGNYFIVKNSWGTDWGDGGYCYIPKRLLADSEPNFVAIGLGKQSGLAAALEPRAAPSHSGPRATPTTPRFTRAREAPCRRRRSWWPRPRRRR